MSALSMKPCAEVTAINSVAQDGTIMCNRRALLTATFASSLMTGPLFIEPCVSTTQLPSSVPSVCLSKTLPFREAITFVHRCDPAFLLAVRESRRFLYRGENAVGFSTSRVASDVSAVAAYLCPAPDLLLAGTYDESDALSYFRCLEDSLSLAEAQARPSTGHIGVSGRSEAAKWGQAVSVWPIGTLHYSWITTRQAFWPLEPEKSRRRDIPACSGEEPSGSGLRLDVGLAEALSLGHEVLFSTDAGSAYVAISEAADADVWSVLLDR